LVGGWTGWWKGQIRVGSRGEVAETHDARRRARTNGNYRLANGNRELANGKVELANRKGELANRKGELANGKGELETPTFDSYIRVEV
jgi:hypothetical protein